MIIPEKTKKILDKSKVLTMAAVDKTGVPDIIPVSQYEIEKDTIVITAPSVKFKHLNLGNVCISTGGEYEGESIKLKGIVCSSKIKGQPKKAADKIMVKISKIYDLPGKSKINSQYSKQKSSLGWRSDCF